MEDLTAAIVLLTLTLFTHLIEEIKTGYRNKLFIREMPRPVLIDLNTLIYIYCLINDLSILAGKSSSNINDMDLCIGQYSQRIRTNHLDRL